MRCVIPAVLILSLAGAVFGQSRQVWSLGGFGNVVYPGTGHAPGATPPVGQFVASSRGGGGYSRGFANPGRANHPQHSGTVIVPYPVYYGGYYGTGYGYDPSAAGYAPPGPSDDGSQGYGSGVPSVVINQSFVPPQANPQVREYTGDQPAPQDQSRLEAVSSAAVASLCGCPGAAVGEQRPAHHLPHCLPRSHHRAGAGLLDGGQHTALRERRADAQSGEHRSRRSRSVATSE